jgi:15-cis-phytoene synthase
MFKPRHIRTQGKVWTSNGWAALELETRSLALEAYSEREAWEIIIKRARRVLKTYSTSFFIVTRFLPPLKREKVEAIYAAVRYPDEIVDTFQLDQLSRTQYLNSWAMMYERGLAAASIGDALGAKVPSFLAAFTKVVREAWIPPEHYRAFIEAMRRDIAPRPFETLDDLIETYIYGSAIVVGYFLTYVYGPDSPGNFERALRSARSLGIALQLTNFLRDVCEDERRGRVYLPLDQLRAEGIAELKVEDVGQQAALSRVLRRMAAIAEEYYRASLRDLDAFAPDSQLAIRACISVYRRLNERIGRSPHGIMHRESVPASEKFKALPPSKYWRIPLAYLRR